MIFPSSQNSWHFHDFGKPTHVRHLCAPVGAIRHSGFIGSPCLSEVGKYSELAIFYGENNCWISLIYIHTYIYIYIYNQNHVYIYIYVYIYICMYVIVLYCIVLYCFALFCIISKHIISNHTTSYYIISYHFMV